MVGVYSNEKTQGPLRRILFIEVIASVERFFFFNFIGACELLNETFNTSHNLTKV